jgi:hypothetical protein
MDCRVKPGNDGYLFAWSASVRASVNAPGAARDR